MMRIWLVNWHFQSRITLWCRHKSTNVSMRLCWQMPKFIVWRLWSIYFDHHLPLKPSIRKRRKQSCIPNKRWKTADELQNPNGTLKNWYWPLCVTNDVYLRSLSFTGIWKKPFFKLIELNTRTSCNLSMISSISGSE